MNPELKRKLEDLGLTKELVTKLLISESIPVIEELQAIRFALESLVSKEEPKEERPEVQRISLEGVELVTIKGEKGDPGENGEKGEVGERGRDGRNGKDGKDGKDGTNGLNGLDGKDGRDGVDGKDGSPDTGDQIISKINESDGIIKRERVEGLDEEIKKLNTKIDSKPTGGVRRVYQPYVDDLSDSTDGNNKTFYLSREPLKSNAVLVWGTDFPVILRPTIDFTVTGRTLTLTSAVPAPTSGATIMCQYYA